MNSAWVLNNGIFELTIKVNKDDCPYISSLSCSSNTTRNWAPALPHLLGPCIIVNGEFYKPGQENMKWMGGGVNGLATKIYLDYKLSCGLDVRYVIAAYPHQMVMKIHTELYNASSGIVEVSRFDALNMHIGVSEAQPWSAYLLGWLWGPREDAPGRHAVPYPYPGNLTQTLFGLNKEAVPPPPSGGWASPVLKLIKERLTKLPLRAGGRSTYDNHPWVTVSDHLWNGGFFAGLEWSGKWKIETEYMHETSVVSLYAHTDGNIHHLHPEDKLVSPAAFMGFYQGDFDDGFNACRRFTGSELVPKPPKNFPLLHFCTPDTHNENYEDLLKEVDVVSDLGFESFYIDARWWASSVYKGDFSIGLGDYSEHRGKFPDGIKAVSDYVHKRGMKFGLWFEFERVDIRTAGKGRNPWKLEWIVHEDGVPSRSWCQYVYRLCLGVPEAAEWARENIVWAIREYGIDWMMMDSNGWLCNCNDTSHGHGKYDSDWARIQGLYYVLSGIRSSYPDLIIENCGGGSQRGDFGMARYCNLLACHDTNTPSSLIRQFGHGVGSIFPSYYPKLDIYPYPDDAGSDWAPVTMDELRVEIASSTQQLEWRTINRMLGLMQFIYDPLKLNKEYDSVLRSLLSFYKKVRPALHGERYILSEPATIFERRNKEADCWEVHQFNGLEGDLAVIFAFRCMSVFSQYRALLRGLEPSAIYSVETYSHAVERAYTGKELMGQGLLINVGSKPGAEIVLLKKRMESPKHPL